MQSVLSRIWTRVAVSISYDDNHYTMGTSQIVIIIRVKIVAVSYFEIKTVILRTQWESNSQLMVCF